VEKNIYKPYLMKIANITEEAGVESLELADYHIHHV